jgi:parvulin-like peptidyl-prolyl isomerase
MKSFFILFVTVVFCSISFAQNDESIVAQIGNDKITAKELKLRLELSPYIPSENNIDPDSIKYDFLYSLIAEKLWAKDALTLGVLNSDNFNFAFKPLEEMFIRDALFKKEVEDKVLLSATDINNGILKSQVKLNVQIATANDSTSIFKLYYQMQYNINFDSLISLNKNITNNKFDITLGTLKDEEIEDSLFSLQNNGYTAPIKSEVGWVILIVRNKTFTPIDLGDQQAVENMKKIISNRRIKKRYEEYLKSLLSGITININPQSFKLLQSKIWELLKNKFILKDSSNYFEISESDFNNIKISLGTNGINEQLFTLHDREISINDFLSSLAFNGFNVSQIDSQIVQQKLNRNAKQFVQDQLLAEEGYRLGLQLDKSVRNDLNIWRENYLAQLYFNSNLDSVQVSDKEVYNYYLNEIVNKSNISLINLRLISLKNLDEVSNIFELIKQGKDFADLVRSYGRTDSLVDDKGETGLTPIVLLGYVGSVARDLNLNVVYGPIKRNNGYTILQVIERMDSNDSLKLSFDTVKDQLKNDLRFKKLKERLDNITANLAVTNNVKIYSNVVNKIESSHIPFFVHRLMGFGGRIAGVPLTTPFAGWINKEVKQKLYP